MNFRLPSAALAALALVVLNPARAQETQADLPAQITLPALLKLVAERSPRLAVERLAIDSAEAERIGAAALPNPTVSFGRFKPSGGARTIFDAGSQQQTTLDFPLLLANQRGARIEAADQGILAARAHVSMASQELAARAADTFIGLQAAQDKVRVLDTVTAEIRRLSAIVSERFKLGVASRYEVTRVDIELSSMMNRVDDARIEAAARSAAMAALVGVRDWRPAALGEVAPARLSADAAQWRASIMDANTQILAARRDEAAALAALRRAERERIPVPVLSVGRTWTGDPYGGANYVGVSAEIPILDKKTGPVAKADAEYRAAQQRRAAVEAEVDAEVARAVEALAKRRSALEHYESSIASKLGPLKQMAEDYYQLGRGSILELIDSARSRVDAALALLDLRSLVAQEEARLLAMSGKLGE